MPDWSRRAARHAHRHAAGRERRYRLWGAYAVDVTVILVSAFGPSHLYRRPRCVRGEV